MPWRTAAIGVRLPLLMTGIVLVASTVFVWLAYAEYERVLVDSTSARLEANATLVQGLLTGAGSNTTSGGAVGRAAQSPTLRRALSGAESAERAVAEMATLLPQLADSTRARVRLISLLGDDVAVHTLRYDLTIPTWIEERASRALLPRTNVIVSPIIAGDTLAFYEYAVPIHARPDNESLIGYLVETRFVRGRNAASVRRLIGSEVLIIGQPGAGVWTDLERVVPGPPQIVRLDTAFSFDESPRGPGLGVAKQIPGSPWQMWVQLSRAEVLAPANTFVLRMLPVGITITLLAVLAAWMFSRGLSHRLMRLVERVDAMGGGAPRRGARSVDRRDEVQRLADAFTAMADRAAKQQALETQLQQSQKLEAVGTLAGGIAHDFNNMLTVVMNYAEIVGADLPPDSAAARDIKEVLHASEGAANLTRQLLAFSRRQILKPVPTALNDVIRAAHRMLGRVIPSNVEFHLDLDDKIGAINADQGQLEQVLMNLTLNAADAMPNGGRLTFRTTIAELDETLDILENTGEHRHEGPLTRRHVCLVVADTGIGMDRATVQRVFEPFFTTKAQKGTGLGLASVHGIVSQLGGRIWVYSELGHGTTFKLYFPELDAAAIPLPERPALPKPGSVSGTILLVEDDPGTREVTRRILARQGYTVVVAHHGGEALALMTRGLPDVRLVISDVMMPTMDGVELATRLAQRWPALPVLLMSGYSDAEVRARADQVRRVKLLEKPFTSATLLEAATAAMRDGANGTKP